MLPLINQLSVTNPEVNEINISLPYKGFHLITEFYVQ